MAIYGTQVPMYTRHTLFLFLFFFLMKNKINKTEKKKKKKPNKNMLNKAKHKTRLAQKVTQNTQEIQKN